MKHARHVGDSAQFAAALVPLTGTGPYNVASELEAGQAARFDRQDHGR